LNGSKVARVNQLALFGLGKNCDSNCLCTHFSKEQD